MDIVAEGVEDELEATMMTSFGCTELQGFYFSKAIAADRISKLRSTFQSKRFVQAHSPCISLGHKALRLILPMVSQQTRRIDDEIIPLWVKR